MDPYCQATLKAILKMVFFKGNKNSCLPPSTSTIVYALGGTIVLQDPVQGLFAGSLFSSGEKHSKQNLMNM